VFIPEIQIIESGLKNLVPEWRTKLTPTSGSTDAGKEHIFLWSGGCKLGRPRNNMIFIKMRT